MVLPHRQLHATRRFNGVCVSSGRERGSDGSSQLTTLTRSAGAAPQDDASGFSAPSPCPHMMCKSLARTEPHAKPRMVQARVAVLLPRPHPSQHSVSRLQLGGKARPGEVQ